jgi:Na+-driven multidrug efflux pump
VQIINGLHGSGGLFAQNPSVASDPAKTAAGSVQAVRAVFRRAKPMMLSRLFSCLHRFIQSFVHGHAQGSAAG